MKIDLPSKIILSSGVGVGKTKLNAFDNALLNAKIGNFNLLKVSSVVPPNAKIIYLSENNYKKILPKHGSIVPVVYSCIYGEKIGERITSVLALGIPKDYKNKNGLIFEFNANGISKNKAEKICQEMLIEGFKQRNLELKEVLLISEEHIVKEKIACVITAALML